MRLRDFSSQENAANTRFAINFFTWSWWTDIRKISKLISVKILGWIFASFWKEVERGGKRKKSDSESSSESSSSSDDDSNSDSES